MGVVVNDGDAVHFTFMLKPSVGAAVGTKRRGGRFDGNVKQVCQRDGGHCIIDIVFAGNAQREYVFFSASPHKMERGTTRRIIGDACRMVVTVGRRAVSDDLAGKSSVISSKRSMSPLMISVPSAGKSAAKRWKELRIS